MKAKYSKAEIAEEDGLRLSWEKSWLLIRPSNTEPVIRIFAEAETKKEAEKLTKSVVKLAKAY